jgi:hypothetical protein
VVLDCRERDFLATLNFFSAETLGPIVVLRNFRAIAVLTARGIPPLFVGGTNMKKITCVLAILAAASTAAPAKDLKQDKKATAPAVSATQMSDAEMDKVTAGAAAYVSVQTLNWLNPGQVYVTVFNDGQENVLRYPGIRIICVNGNCLP